MKGPDNNSEMRPHQALDRLEWRLSFFAPGQIYTMARNLFVELTAEKQRLLEEADVESDSDCACE